MPLGLPLIGSDPQTGRFETTLPTPPLRLQTTRRFGDATNRLALADNLALLRTLPDDSIDLVYIDPPFATGTRRTSPRSSASFSDDWHGVPGRAGSNTGPAFPPEPGAPSPAGGRDVGRGTLDETEGPQAGGARGDGKAVEGAAAGASACSSSCAPRSTSSLPPSTLAPRPSSHSLAAYLGWLNARLFEIRRVLRPTATLYVHLDWHVVHYVKVELDKLFGADNFRNEIVWHYNSGPRRQCDFGRRHDLILRYTKTDRYVFHPDAVRQPYSPDIHIPPSKAHYYHPRGKVMDDVWRIPILPQNDHAERLGYPTQKPEALLDLIVRASSNEGDLIADFFCGSGTALAVAARLGRRWIGCDSNPDAIGLAARRLSAPLWGAAGFVVETQ